MRAPIRGSLALGLQSALKKGPRALRAFLDYTEGTELSVCENLSPVRMIDSIRMLKRKMAEFKVSTNGTLQAAKSFLSASNYFDLSQQTARLIFAPKWMHMEPFALAMIAAWAGWCEQKALPMQVEGLTRSAAYAWRMKLFQYLPSIEYNPPRIEHAEAGRFLPIKNVRNAEDARAVIADISALLHLTDNPEGLAAVQYCISELIRNVLEHSGSPQGAYVCAHNFANANPPRVSIGIADCGGGIASHLGRAYPEALKSDIRAVQLALQPGITGAIAGAYGTPDNAGAGLFITRSIAKGTGGYFLIYSGTACYRLRRATVQAQAELFPDAFEERRHDLWPLDNRWQGTVVAVEIRTDRIPDFDQYFGWIREHISAPDRSRKRIRFT